MARANVYNDGIAKKSNKPLIISVISAIAVVLIAGVVCLGLWLGGVFDKKEIKTYFDDYANLKISVEDLSLKLNQYRDENSEKHTFVFVYDNSTFSHNADEYNEHDEEIVQGFELLFAAIDKKSIPDENAFELFIVDSSLEENKDILNNSTYGDIKEGSALLYYYQGTYYTETPESLKNQFKDGVDNEYTLSIVNDESKLIKKMKGEVVDYINKIYDFKN